MSARHRARAGFREATERKGAVQGWERTGCTSQRGPPLPCLGDSGESDMQLRKVE